MLMMTTMIKYYVDHVCVCVDWFAVFKYLGKELRVRSEAYDFLISALLLNRLFGVVKHFMRK